MAQVQKFQMVSVQRLHPNEWNPNECDSDMMAELVSEIRDDGFDQPLQVVPCECDKIKGSHFKIIGGEHRWKAAQVVELKELPAVVYSDWDESRQKIKTVRRNMLHGVLNSSKFSALVGDLETGGLTRAEIAQAMAFDSEQAMLKCLDEPNKVDARVLADIDATARRDADAVNSLTDVIQNLFRDCGDTVDQGFLVFAYKGKTHVLVLMSDDMEHAMTELISKVKASGENMNQVLLEAVQRGDV